MLFPIGLYGAKGELSAQLSSPTVAASGGTVTLSISSNTGWIVESNQSWAPIPASFQEGEFDQSFDITVSQQNLNATQRTATITVRTPSGSFRQNITLRQSAGQLTIGVLGGINLDNLTSGAQSFSVSVESNINGWALSESVSWLSISGGATGSQDATRTINVVANAVGVSTRSAALTVAAGSLSASLDITQRQETPSIDISGSNVSGISSAGISFARNVTSNTNWSINTPSWVTASPSSGSAGTRQVTFTIASNASVGVSNRSGTITASTSIGSASDSFSVTQNQTSPTVDISGGSQNGVASSGFTFSRSITSNTSWTISTPSWVTASPSSGTGSRSVTFTVSSNQSVGTGTRSGTISIATTVGSASDSFGITQNQTAPFLNILGGNISGLSANGGSVTRTIDSNVSWSVSDNAGWLTVSPTSGSGDRTLTITAQTHVSGLSRSATVTVTGGGLTRSITVSQSGVVIRSLSVSPNNVSGLSGGGSRTVTVSASNLSGNWSISSIPFWISVSPTSGGNGSRTVTLTFSINNTGFSRSDNLTLSASGVSNRTISTSQPAQPIAQDCSDIICGPNEQCCSIGGLIPECVPISTNDGGLEQLELCLSA
ncbi:MAG: BACON domain-containing carbohydrate-binding protein [Bacteroidota bacterium]